MTTHFTSSSVIFTDPASATMCDNGATMGSDSIELEGIFRRLRATRVSIVRIGGSLSLYLRRKE